MIAHHPYGIDDPYKRLPTERYPRDPEAGNDIQVGFQTSSPRAWVVLEAQEKSVRIAAQRSSEDLWHAVLGRLDAGVYRYWLHAEGEDPAGPFELEVGRWCEAERVEGVFSEQGRVAIKLATADSKGHATLHLSFPHTGVCSASFTVGQPAALSAGLPFEVVREGTQLELIAEGIVVTLDTQTLELAARRSSAAYPLFHGSARLRWLATCQGEATRLQLAFKTEAGEAFYGLGERFTGPNLKGQRWDVRVYEEYKEQGRRSYLPLPFLVSTRAYGLWLDAEEPSEFDLTGETCTITLEKLPTEAATLSLRVLVAEESYGVTAAFTRLTGEIQVPPKWAFGPWMSANTWNTQAKVEEAVRRTLTEEVPATVLVLEAWSDESTFYIFNGASYTPTSGDDALSLTDFTFGEHWPDPKALVDECHEHGMRVLLWQIPVQKKVSEPHAQHEADEAHMLRQGYAIQNADGSPYRCQGWWFTDGLVLDFTNPEARDWWFTKRRYLLDELGIDGVKTDGGEHLWGRGLRAHDGRRGLELYNAYPNLYVGAYHTFVQERTGGDGLTFSRAGYTGAQRFPGHWAGDENSTWSAFKASILAGLSAGVSGVSIWGWDIGGFSGEIPTVELYARSVAMACFCPIMQYHSELHSAAENRDRTPWNIAERQGDPRALAIYRRYAKVRMQLLDYLYEETITLSAKGLPLMRYPALEFPQHHDFLAQDPFAYLFGRDLLVCPVIEKGAITREVRVPPGNWIDLWSGARFTGPSVIVAPAPLDTVPVFVRENSTRLEALRRVADAT